MKWIDHIAARKYYLLLVDSSDDSAYLQCFLKKKELLDLQFSNYFQSFGEAIKNIPAKSPVILSLKGNACLTKLSDQGKSAYSDFDLDEFYYQSTAFQNGIILESIVRKSYVNNISSMLSERKVFLLDIILTATAIPFLEGALFDGYLQLDHLNFHFSDKEIISITKQKVENKEQECAMFQIGNTEYDLIASSGIASMIKFLSNDSEGLQEFEANRIENKFYQRFKCAGIVSLASIFSFLLINFILFSNSDKKLKELSTTYQGTLNLISQIEDLQSDLDEYSSLTGTSKKSNATYAFYADRFGFLKPQGLWLNSLVISPLSNSRDASDLDFDNEMIRVKGEVKNPLSLNTYVKLLKQEFWVKDVKVKAYETRAEKSFSEFVIEILL